MGNTLNVKHCQSLFIKIGSFHDGILTTSPSTVFSVEGGETLSSTVVHSHRWASGQRKHEWREEKEKPARQDIATFKTPLFNSLYRNAF
jgi:hypothetical protein